MTYPWPAHLRATCSHDGSRQIGLRVRFVQAEDTCVCDVNRCFTCGEFLSLGPSNETDERVAVEIRAAEIAANAETRAVRKHTDGAEIAGWIISVHDSMKGLEQPGEWSGFLAAEIFYAADKAEQEGK